MATWISELGLLQLLALVAGFHVGLTVLCTGVGFLLERILRHRRVWAVPLDRGQYGFELVGNLRFLSVQSIAFTAVLYGGLIRFDEVGDASAIGTFVAVYYSFQIYYYGLHRLMHRRPWIRFHRWHHRSRVTTPLTGQSMSAAEALGWALGYVGLPALLSLWTPLSFAGWAAYIVYNISGNIIGHVNVEFHNPFGRSRLVSVIQPPVIYHALHHARWTGHYGFASTGLDGLFSTEFADWQAVVRRVDGGQPLTSLKQRVTS